MTHKTCAQKVFNLINVSENYLGNHQFAVLALSKTLALLVSFVQRDSAILDVTTGRNGVKSHDFKGQD